ncbi:MAG: NADPH-dependent 7-cyano-7-deazaguanine reductase QueF [Chitinispirillaceae bacterium]|nr:NADPH-dependent 7-cyano-7-deazaguanine reductase QueF [Chitinispirillaceae bacterium]
MFFENVIPLEAAIGSGKLPQLETFPCPYDTSVTKNGIIRIIFPEFTCVCPKTGYPDFASIGVWYLPDRLCIELKSWKLYLNAFRMVGTFHETVTRHLYVTMEELLKPVWLLVAGDFFPRGNVDTTVVFESPSPRPKGVDLLLAPLVPRARGFDETVG